MIKTNNLKKLYDSDGYVVVKNFINFNEVKNIKQSVLNHINKNSSILKGRDIALIKNTNTINSISNLKKWNYVRKLQKTKKIKDLVKIFLGSKFKNFGAELFAKPAKVGLPAPIHQDNYYWNILDAKGITVWLALDNANKKNGAVFYYKKSHKIGLLDHKPSRVRGLSQEVKKKNFLKNYKKKTPNLKPGDVLVHNCMIVHGSNKNLSKFSRIGLTMRFISSTSSFNTLRKKKYELDLLKFLKKN
jgi:phytanoyl-CoA hydroxylase